jgi:hypothetical protein
MFMGRLIITGMLAALALSGCMSQREIQAQEEAKRPIVVKENKVPGTVDHYWVEPMHDVVQVPAQLDPTGTYYRPSHNEVVEIRPERFEKVEYQGDKIRLPGEGK